jgi:glucose/arabinose dehydrogenase
VLTGFVDGDGAHGRPVGLALSKQGDLLVADDTGGVVWRISAAPR